MQRIGLISDTHDLLRPEAIAFLRDCAMIVHAGDICEPTVLDQLEKIAPVIAVRGNNDRGAWAEAVPPAQTIVVDGVTLHVVHDVADLVHFPAPAGAVVIHGHSHRPAAVERDGHLFVNPGSAGPRRFDLPISIGELSIDDGHATPRLVNLVPHALVPEKPT